MTEQEKIISEKERHENFMREMDDDFRRINHLSADTDIHQILAGVNGK